MNFDHVNTDLLALTRQRSPAVDPNLPIVQKLRHLLGVPDAVAVLVDVAHKHLQASALHPMTALATIADVNIAHNEAGLPAGTYIHLVLRLPKVDPSERALVLYEQVDLAPPGPPRGI